MTDSLKEHAMPGLSIPHRQLGTVLAALKWWRGRSGPAPFILQHCFEHMPPLDRDELDALIEEVTRAITDGVREHA
jgi:hypothetical protein